MKTTDRITQKTDKLLNNTNAKWVAFRQFIFAPNLLTFVISVVVGNSFGSAIKDLISTVSGTVNFLIKWSLYKDHPLDFDLIASPFGDFFNSFLTMLFIAVTVFYTIQFINKSLIRTKEEQWGFDQAHEDALVFQKMQAENNKLQAENAQLQKQMLAKLDALTSQKN
ncbi:MscL family protein [Convivina intestini]|uniref:Large-conductance mechanosensitive channel n=1 Tax=Convivina intestini TaxID=1505726 RepID=A0A2U1D7P3_9LACO|nr:MscL family protein [Convivina intestini]PVY83695.1 large-conductance mechanosensitive channel [Convivina intestini]CAH1853277.1 hypothetical protein R078131_00715 [Convivina intestini]CAH1855203.1 hypothetical protein R077811_01015 [Convivina intestini]SDB92129.1 Large-conductance mechanosensitive channel [Leuconostocaceae bacterium R-53105]